MLTLLGIIVAVSILLVIGLILGAVALPIIAVVFVIGLVLSIIALIFKVLVGPIAIIALIIIAITFFKKNRRGM